jgi:hypothetical protein
MTDVALLEMVRRVPAAKRQELYDFARFLVETYAEDRGGIEPFGSEDEMIAFIADVGQSVYAD